MTDQQVECIVALVEEGSFSKAAEKLFISQPGNQSEYKTNGTAVWGEDI